MTLHRFPLCLHSTDHRGKETKDDLLATLSRSDTASRAAKGEATDNSHCALQVYIQRQELTYSKRYQLLLFTQIKKWTKGSHVLCKDVCSQQAYNNSEKERHRSEHCVLPSLRGKEVQSSVIKAHNSYNNRQGERQGTEREGLSTLAARAGLCVLCAALDTRAAVLDCSTLSDACTELTAHAVSGLG